MTARIQRSFDFMAGVHFGTEMYTNLYEFDASFNVEAESIEEQNIALERIKYFLDECVQHSIMVHDSETEVIEKLLNADLRICTLPEEPYDQIVGIMLMNKLNSIAEGRLMITDIAITSRLSDGVTCFHSIEENMGPFKLGGWWDDNTPILTDVKQKGKKVIKLKKTNFDWAEFDLNWLDEKPKKSDSEIVYVNFDKLDK
jgi:hypothetical protein